MESLKGLGTPCSCPVTFVEDSCAAGSARIQKHRNHETSNQAALSVIQPNLANQAASTARFAVGAILNIHL